MQTYVSGVKIVADKLLASKGLAVEDYISKEKNRGELSLYLLCRMTQKHACVIGKNSMWYTSCCKDKDQDITVADCQIVLVYLGAGTVWDTKLVATASKKNLPPKVTSNYHSAVMGNIHPHPPRCTTRPLKDAAQDQWDSFQLSHLNFLLQSQNLKLNYPHLMGSNLQVSLKFQTPSQNIVAAQENLTLSKRKFTKSAGAPV